LKTASKVVGSQLTPLTVTYNDSYRQSALRWFDLLWADLF